MTGISFYFDEMMPRAPVKPPEELGLAVVMAVDVDMTEKEDSEHLRYARENKLIVVTFDRPFAGRTAKETGHNGLICLSGTQENVGYIVRTLSEFAQEHTLDSAAGHVFWR